MFRRVLSLLLMPCVLLTQSAVSGHAHGGHEPHGHDARPHLHIFSGTHNHRGDEHDDDESHHHHHYHGSGHHHHHDESSPEQDTESATDPEPMSEHEHDSDAVYISQLDVVVNERATSSDELAASLVCTLDQLKVISAARSIPEHESANWTHAPPGSDTSCPLYIWQLSLLI